MFIGHQGVLQWQAMVDDAFKEMHFEPDRVDELPDGRVLALVRFRFRAPSGGQQSRSRSLTSSRGATGR